MNTQMALELLKRARLVISSTRHSELWQRIDAFIEAQVCLPEQRKFATHCPGGQPCGATTTGCVVGQCQLKAVAWMITDPDGRLSAAVTLKPQDPISSSGLVITPLIPQPAPVSVGLGDPLYLYEKLAPLKLTEAQAKSVVDIVYGSSGVPDGKVNAHLSGDAAG